MTLEKLQTYQQCGINRISIGLQETHNQLLKQIGRIHTYEEFLQTFTWAREAGFQNINVDLMIALPKQTMEDVEDNLQKVIRVTTRTYICVFFNYRRRNKNGTGLTSSCN